MSDAVNIKMKLPGSRFYLWIKSEDSISCSASLMDAFTGRGLALHYFIRPHLQEWLSVYQREGYRHFDAVAIQREAAAQIAAEPKPQRGRGVGKKRGRPRKPQAPPCVHKNQNSE